MSGFPTGVAVVSGIDAQAGTAALTCTSLVSVTVTPPVMIVSLSIRSRTLEAIRSLGGFGVNLLPARGRAIADFFASGRLGPILLGPLGSHAGAWGCRGPGGLLQGLAECEVCEI